MRITNGFEEHAMVGLDGCAQEGLVARDRGRHGVTGPAPRARCSPSMSVKRKVTVPEGRSGMGAPRW